MLEEFLSYLQEQVDNGSIYVLGAQGQTGAEITEEWIKAREHKRAANYNRATALWKKRISAGYNQLRAFDCSGLGMYFIQNLKGLSGDLNANGMLGKCARLTRKEVKRGDWVFKVSGGRAGHIGYIVDDDLNVIEAQGRAYGVVKRPLSAGRWNTFGRPIWFAAEIDAQEEVREHMIFNRNLKKGMKGDDVRELQALLNSAGFSCGAADGAFGTKTYRAVRAAQAKYHLTMDGIAGRNTVTALGGQWGLYPSGDMTVCTFNIKRGTYKNGTYKRIAEIVRGASIVGLQEITPAGLKKIAAYAGMTGYMCQTITGYGHAILTNFSVDAEDITTLGGGGERRKLHHLMFGGVSFYNTHLHYAETANNIQLAQLADILGADGSRTVIVTGDFNRQDYEALMLLGFCQANTGQAIRNTEGGASIVNKIDQIFVRGALTVDISKFEAVAKGYSDHDALFAKIKIN